METLVDGLREMATYHRRIEQMTYGDLATKEAWFASVATQAAAALERYQWIPVSEGLPEEGQQVFVYHEKLGLGESDALNDGEFWSRPSPTHWLAIPDLPPPPSTGERGV